jgi:sugar lactone lactonase YvrE
MRTVDECELLLDARAGCGEGPVWDERSQRLVWVDLSAALVHRFDPAAGAMEPWSVGQVVGSLAPRANGGFVAAARDGFGVLDDAGTLEIVAPVETGKPGMLMNDGKCDAAGRFWAGSTHVEGTTPVGSLYRLDTGGQATPMLGGLTISNGIDWSLDGRAMYYVDSPTRRIDVFSFDPDAGLISERRTFAELEPGTTLPDGVTADADGYIWVAIWGGWCLHRYTPDGQLDMVVRLPVSQVTCCAFGGAELDELYITSARDDLSPEQLREEPLAGGLFRVRPGVRGRQPNSYGG